MIFFISKIQEMVCLKINSNYLQNQFAQHIPPQNLLLSITQRIENYASQIVSARNKLCRELHPYYMTLPLEDELKARVSVC